MSLPVPAAHAWATVCGSQITPSATSRIPASSSAVRSVVPSHGAPAPGLSPLSERTSGKRVARRTRSIASGIGVSAAPNAVRRCQAVAAIRLAICRASGSSFAVVTSTRKPASRTSLYGKAAGDTDVQHARAGTLALGDSGERAHGSLFGGALGWQRHEHRRSRESGGRADSGDEKPGEDFTRLEAALVRVDMRIGRVGDERIGRRHHLGGEIGVRIECRDNRHARPDERAHGAEQIGFRVRDIFRHHRAV